ncbi:MAG: hypothetical protein H7246_11140 [Phycisphaerae bacterium]|nr:hypothetical protein [Saprospiraceae bacterium]
MDFKKFTPHLIAIAVLFAVSAVFFAPNFFGGKALPQPDNDKARGMQTEIQDYIKKGEDAPLWTNSAFGGMPSYQIYTPIHGNLTKPLVKATFLWTDATGIWAQVLAAMLFMYLLIITLGADWRVAIFGATAYGISTYNVDILEAGHSTKMAALAFAPGVLAATVQLFRGRLLAGAGLLALLTAMQIYVNHVQITYYTLLIAGIYVLAQLADAVRYKALVRWGKHVVIMGLAIAMGFACNLSKLWPTYEYGQETIRGKSELKASADKGDGLSKDYLFGWSYGVCESMTLLVPHFAGGGAGETFGDTKLLKAISRQMPPNTTKAQMQAQIASIFYDGDQPFVGTAIYYGAIVCFLFFLGAFLVEGPVKWWLLLSGIFMVTLAWGKNFFLNDILYDYLPMFSKFRAVSMALGPGHLCVAALAAMGIQRLADADVSAEKKKRSLWMGLGATVLLCLVGMFCVDGVGPNDDALGQNAQLLAALKEDRASMLRADLIRSLAFVAAAASLIFFYLRGSLKAGLMVGLVATLSLADTWLVCMRSLPASKYESKQAATNPPKEETFDNQIKADKDPYYRVLDLARGGITGNATTSYFHKSLSGYHAAKLQRFQEVVDKYLSRDLGKNLHIVGMMNGKYLITDKGQVFPNPEACGNAWFVQNFQTVKNGDDELNALGPLNPKDTAVVQESYTATLQGLNLQRDSNDYIRLTSYHPDRMEYEYSAKTEQLAVFSEMYYPPSKGWKCYLNGQPAPDFIKADYLLRAMRLPAGEKQKLEMRFEPRSFYLGEKVAYGASAITLLLCLAALFFWYRKGGHIGEAANLSDVEVKVEKPVKAAAAKAGGKKKG